MKERELVNLSERQEQIIEASLKIILEKGIQNLTIRSLSTQIGLTEAAIYRHFVSKESILAAIAGKFGKQSTHILSEILKTPESGLLKIKRFFLGRLNQFANDKGLVLVMFSEEIFKDYPDLQKEVHFTMASHKKMIVQAFKEEQAIGRLAKDLNPEYLFIIVMGALRLLVSRWSQFGFSFNLTQEGEQLWNCLEQLFSKKNPLNGEEKNETKNYRN